MATRNSVRISKKHGVNPSMLVCPCCLEDTGVALLGQLPKDAEAPREMLDREPCDKCKEMALTHLVIVGSSSGVMMGGYIAIKEEAATYIFPHLDKWTGFALADMDELPQMRAKLEEMIESNESKKD